MKSFVKILMTGLFLSVMSISCTKENAESGAKDAGIVTGAAYVEYVDLGLLSGLKWATCNIGANSPEEYGDYYAWGETETKSGNYAEYTYKYYKSVVEYFEPGGNKTVSGYTKYVPMSKAESSGFKGFYDDKTTLDLKDDVANVKFGGKWRMPTDEEWRELINNCSWQWGAYKGVNGYKVTGKKTGYTDKWIFLPAAGFRYGGSLCDVGSDGYYWSSSLDTDYPDYAFSMNFFLDHVYRYFNNRSLGQSVRPVSE